MDYHLFNKSDGISESELSKLVAYYKDAIPLSYLNFLQYTNGYLFINSSTLIYSSYEIVERNITSEVCKYLAEYIAIGDKDGDKLILMKKGRSAKKIFIADNCSISMKDFSFQEEYDDFSLFIESCKVASSEMYAIDTELLYDVILIAPIYEKRIILELKRIFNYNGNMTTLLKNCQNPPFVVKNKITYGLAKKLISRNEELSKFLMVKEATK